MQTNFEKVVPFQHGGQIADFYCDFGQNLKNNFPKEKFINENWLKVGEYE